jgi:hypothetical protein
MKGGGKKTEGKKGRKEGRKEVGRIPERKKEGKTENICVI